MIAISIILGIVFLIAVLCICPVTVYISFIDRDLEYTVKYLTFDIMKSKENPEEIRRAEEKAKRKAEKKRLKRKKKRDKILKKSIEKSSHEEIKNNINNPIRDSKEIKDKHQEDSDKKKDAVKEDKYNTDDIFEKISTLKDFFNVIKKKVPKVYRKIYVSDLIVDFTISDEDAYECAMSYGKMNIIVYNAIAVLSAIFRIHTKKISLKCEFNKPDSIYNLSMKIKVRLGTAIWAILSTVLTYVLNQKNEEEHDEEKSKFSSKKNRTAV